MLPHLQNRLTADVPCQAQFYTFHPSPFQGYPASSPGPKEQDRQGQRQLNRAATPSSIPTSLSSANQHRNGPASVTQHLPFSFFPPPTNPRSAPSKADPPTPQRPSGCATSWDQPPCQRCYPSAHRTRHWPNFGEDGQRAETHTGAEETRKRPSQTPCL